MQIGFETLIIKLIYLCGFNELSAINSILGQWLTVTFINNKSILVMNQLI